MSFRGRVRQEFLCCLPLQGGNLIVGQASKPNNGGRGSRVRYCFIKKWVMGLCHSPAHFTFNMALKFRPVVVTAVLICDPLFNV